MDGPPLEPIRPCVACLRNARRGGFRAQAHYCFTCWTPEHPSKIHPDVRDEACNKYDFDPDRLERVCAASGATAEWVPNRPPVGATVVCHIIMALATPVTMMRTPFKNTVDEILEILAYTKMPGQDRSAFMKRLSNLWGMMTAKHSVNITERRHKAKDALSALLGPRIMSDYDFIALRYVTTQTCVEIRTFISHHGHLPVDDLAVMALRSGWIVEKKTKNDSKSDKVRSVRADEQTARAARSMRTEGGIATAALAAAPTFTIGPRPRPRDVAGTVMASLEEMESPIPSR